MSPEFYWIVVVATTIISASRLTRLATVDKFPPAKWVRDTYSEWTDDNDWWWLLNCGYCFSFWATLIVGGWGWLAGVYDPDVSGNAALVWWLCNGLFAASYLAAVFMANDGDHGDED